MPDALKLPPTAPFERCPRCGRRTTRTTLQNARLWALYERIAERRAVEGRHFTARAWHEYYKRTLLGMLDIELPDGRVMTRTKSTRGLDAAEFGDYMTKVEADAADAGIFLDD